MTTVSVPSRSGKTLFLPVFDEEFEAAALDGLTGLCICCGAEASGVEPDARRYTCEDCGSPGVYGLEELVLMGLTR